jgi:hypothetical protein
VDDDVDQVEAENVVAVKIIVQRKGDVGKKTPLVRA